jgi:hypothetical protein
MIKKKRIDDKARGKGSCGCSGFSSLILAT